MSNNTALIEALQSICRATNADNEITRRVIAAAKGETPARDMLLTGKQAAEILGCHPKTLFAYRRAGKLRSIHRSPRCIRWRKSEVDKLAFDGAGE